PVDCTGSEENTVNLSLSEPVTLTGRVVDSDGSPLAWVGVACRMNENVIDQAYTDRNGVYRLTAAAGPGVVRVYPAAGMITDGYPEQIFETRDEHRLELASFTDRKSTRLNSSHVKISYAVFCLKKKRK